MNHRQLFKEAFKLGYKAAKKRLNETSIDSLQQKLLKHKHHTSDLADGWLGRDSTSLERILRNYDKTKHLDNYVKHYKRLLSLNELLGSIYSTNGLYAAPNNGKAKQKELAEAYKTYLAAKEDLDEVYDIIDNDSSVDYDKRTEVLQWIRSAQSHLEEIRKRYEKYKSAWNMNNGYDDPNGELAKNARRRHQKTQGANKAKRFSDHIAQYQKDYPEYGMKVANGNVSFNAYGQKHKDPISSYYRNM